MNQFCELHEQYKELGSKDSIRSKVEILATKGYIKFFKDGERYGFSKAARTKWGYICVEDMVLKTPKGKVDQKTGEALPEFMNVYPTHYKCPDDGALFAVENPKVWIYPLETEQDKSGKKKGKQCKKGKGNQDDK